MSESYSNAISNVKIMEKKLLKFEQYNRMIEAPNPEEALKILSSSDYDTMDINKSSDYEKAINGCLKKIYKELYHMSPDKNIIDIMSIKYDYNNLKLIIKNKFYDTENLEKLFINYTDMDANYIRECVNDNRIKDLPLEFKDIVVKIISEYEESQDPQLLDIMLDKYMYDAMKIKSDIVGNKFISDFVRQYIDIQNFKIFIRTKKMGKGYRFLEHTLINGGNIDKTMFIKFFDDGKEINEFVNGLSSKFIYKDFSKVVNMVVEEYTRTKSLINMEKLFDNYLTGYVKNAKYKFFGPESLIAYIFAKETETKNIRTIMVGKISDVSHETLKERLRDTYV